MRPEVEQFPSPNFRTPKTRRTVKCVVIHATESATIESPKTWLCDPKSGVSAHYLIGKDGKIFQLVKESDVAWHAGHSEWRGETAVNSISIGIENVNKNDGKDPYPEAQREALLSLVVSICEIHRINAEDVVGHKEIAVPAGRKDDPAGFALETFRADVNKRLKEVA